MYGPERHAPIGYARAPTLSGFCTVDRRAGDRPTARPRVFCNAPHLSDCTAIAIAPSLPIRKAATLTKCSCQSFRAAVLLQAHAPTMHLAGSPHAGCRKASTSMNSEDIFQGFNRHRRRQPAAKQRFLPGSWPTSLARSHLCAGRGQAVHGPHRRVCPKA